MSVEWGSFFASSNELLNGSSLFLPAERENALEEWRGFSAPSDREKALKGGERTNSGLLHSMLLRSYAVMPQWEGKGYLDGPPPLHGMEAHQGHRPLGAVGEEGRRKMVEVEEEESAVWMDEEELDEEPLNAVSHLTHHWLDVMNFFEIARVGEKKESELTAELPDVEHHLLAMFHLLLRERHRIRMVVEEEEGKDAVKGRESGHEQGEREHSTEKGGEGDTIRPPPLDDLCLSASLRSTASVRRPRRRPKGEPKGGEWVAMPDEVWVYLPPCYYYLFGTSTTSFSTSPSSCKKERNDAEGEETGHSSGGSTPHVKPKRSMEDVENTDEEDTLERSSYDSSAEEEEEDAVVYQPVGELFLLWICQWAKHDYPHGTRSMLLHFLAQLLHEADLPPLLAPYPTHSPTPVVEPPPLTAVSSHVPVAASGVPAATAEAGLAVPKDPIGVPRPPEEEREAERNAPSAVSSDVNTYARRCFSVLHISQLHFIPPLLDLMRQTSALLDPSDVSGQTRRREIDPGLTVSSPSSSGTGDKERSAFVRFLCVLAEKIEGIPELANFFITTTENNSAGGGSGGARASSPSSSPSTPFAASADFVLLRSLLPYVVHDSRCPEWGDRRDTCLLALSAVLSLARCPSPEVRDLVAREERVTSGTLKAARTTFTTLCTVPENDDSEIEALFLTDVVRYWSALLFAAPYVSSRLSLLPQIEKEFTIDTVLPLLKNTDERVYSAACLILAALIREVGTSASQVLSHAVRTLLFSTHFVPSKPMADDTHRRASFQPPATFFDAFLIPHLQIHFAANGALEGASKQKESGLPSPSHHHHSFSDPSCSAFRCCKATLILIDAIATYFPAVLMEGALGIAVGKEDPACRGEAASSSDPSSLSRSFLKPKEEGEAPTTRLISLDAYVPFILQTPTHKKRVARRHAAPHNQKSVWAMPPWGGGSHPLPSLSPVCDAAGPESPTGEEDGNAVAGRSRTERRVRPSTVPRPCDSPSTRRGTGKPEEEDTPTDTLVALLLSVVRNEVLSKMLFIESNFPADLLLSHRRHWHASFASLDSEGGREHVDAEAEKKGDHSASSSPKHSTVDVAQDWFHMGVHSSSLSLSLLHLLSLLHVLPPPLCVLVCSTITTLCVLPDPRVLYTLLDKDRGHVKNALQHACDEIEARMDKEIKSIIDVKTSADAASHTTDMTNDANLSFLPGSKGLKSYFSSLWGSGSSKKEEKEERKSAAQHSGMKPLRRSPPVETVNAGPSSSMGYSLHSVTAYRNYFQPLYYVSECGLADNRRERSGEAADASIQEWKKGRAKKSKSFSFSSYYYSHSSHEKKKASDTGEGEAASFLSCAESKMPLDFLASFLSNPPASISKLDLDALVKNASFFQCLSSLERFFYELEEAMQWVSLSVALLQLHC